MLIDKEHEEVRAGVSILTQENGQRNKGKRFKSPRMEEAEIKTDLLRLRLKSVRTLLFYSLLFGAMTGLLLMIDGLPHLPQRIWSWQEIWDKLTGPAVGVPLDFIKYLVCSLGWFMLIYVGFTLVVEGLVDIIYLLSIRLRGGQPGKIARGLKRATGLLPASPLRRALDGLLLGAAFFSVVTTVAGGQGGNINGNSSLTGDNGGGGNQDWELQPPDVAGMVLNYSPGSSLSASSSADYYNNYNAEDRLGVSDSDNDIGFYKLSFQPANNISDQLLDNDQVRAVNNFDEFSFDSGAIPDANFASQQELVDVQYKVKSGDTLWDLAERYYGDGHLYTKIYQANLGQPMGGGAHFSMAGRIYPGWILTIPGVDATKVAGADSPTPQGQPEQATYIVQPGDSMRSIAQRLLANETRWPEIWKLNAGHTMADGRTANNPDLIHPGWKLQLPQKEVPSQPTASAPQSGQNGQQSGSAQNGANKNNPNQDNQNGQGNPNQGANGSGSGQAQTQQPGTALPGTPGGATQSPTTAAPVQTAPVTTPAPVQTPAATTKPAPATPGSQPVANPTPVTSPADNKQNQPAVPTYQTHQEGQEWFWTIIEGLGGLVALAGLSLGLKRIGGSLRRRWRNGGMRAHRRSRWQQYREANRWEQDNSPQTEALIEIETDEQGQETGFAFTQRPIELLRSRLEGFDTDKSRLVLKALQAVFAAEGLPALTPLNCVEAGEQLAYLFTGSPQALSVYLKAASECATPSQKNILEEADFDAEEEVADDEDNLKEGVDDGVPRGKILPFLSGLGGRKTQQPLQEIKDELPQGELAEMIVGQLGGVAWIKKQREGLLVVLEGVEAQYHYTPVAHPDYLHSERVEPQRPAVEDKESLHAGAVISDVDNSKNHSLAQQALETEQDEEDEVYHAYSMVDEEPNYAFDEASVGEEEEQQQEAEVFSVELGLHAGPETEAEANLEKRSFNGVRQEFIEISQEFQNESLVASSGLNLTDEVTLLSDLQPNYLFFGLGAIRATGIEAESLQETSEENYGYFQLCLDTCGNLLLVASQGDEAARTVLFSSLFQIAAAAEPEGIAFYLVDQPIAMTEEELEALPQELGLSEEAAAVLSEELADNQQIFQALAQLPQTVVVIPGDNRGSPGSDLSSWSANTTNLLNSLVEELVTRRAEAAVEEVELEHPNDLFHHRLPRLVVLISSLEAVIAIDKEGLLSQLLTEGPEWGIYILAAASYEGLTASNPSSSQQPTSVLNYIHSLGMFIAPDEEASQLLWGSSTAIELSGYGDMLFRTTNKQITHLRGFCTSAEQIEEATALLHTLYQFNTKPVSDISGTVEPEQHGYTKVEDKSSERMESIPKTLFSEELRDNLESGSIQPAISNLAEQVLEAAEESLTSSGKNSGIKPEASLQDLQVVGETADIAPERVAFVEEAEAKASLVPSVTADGEAKTPKSDFVGNSQADFDSRLQNWRWQMLEQGLIQVALSIHVLHGFSVHFSLLPTLQKSKNGRNSFFPFSPNPIAAYKRLKVAEITFVELAQAGYLNGYVNLNKAIQPERVDEIMTTLSELPGSDSGNIQEELSEKLLTENGLEPNETNQALTLVQTVLHTLSRVESDNLLSQISQGDLALLAYLALHRGAQSCYTVGQAILIKTENEKLMLKALEGRMAHLHKTLRKWFTLCLQEIISKQTPDFLANMAANLNFIEEDNRRETLKLNDKLVYVDMWELDRLMGEYQQASALDKAARIKWLEEAYWLVQSTATNLNDETEESHLKLLGVWGDHNADWPDLPGKRQRIVQRWYDLNMELGNHYRSARPVYEQEDHLVRALEHYSQSALMLPTYPEPIKALIQLYHLKNDLLGLDTIFADYCNSCEQIEEEPEEDIIALYNKAVRSQGKQSSTSKNSTRRKVV